MKTAAHYRALAEECIKWADEAYTNEVRESYLQLARIWLDTASRLSEHTVSGMVPDEPARPAQLPARYAVVVPTVRETINAPSA